MIKSGALEPWEEAFVLLTWHDFNYREIATYLGRDYKCFRRCVTRKLGIRRFIRRPVCPGDQFHDLTVLHFVPRDESRSKSGWMCRCVCGREVWIPVGNLRSGNSRRCKSCKVQRIRTGYGTITGEFFCFIRKSARSRGRLIEFSITPEYLDYIFRYQGGRCAFTGLPLNIDTYVIRGQRKEVTGSVDRIDSDRGYVEGNIQFVHKLINVMKHTSTNDEFIHWCRLVVEHADNSLQYIESGSA
jgi:hypothetical protein